MTLKEAKDWCENRADFIPSLSWYVIKQGDSYIVVHSNFLNRFQNLESVYSVLKGSYPDKANERLARI